LLQVSFTDLEKRENVLKDEIRLLEERVKKGEEPKKEPKK
jgi:hypothetical protein